MLVENGDITHAEIQSGLAAQGVHIGIGKLWRFFDRRGITRKKRTGHAIEQDHLGILRKRQA